MSIFSSTTSGRTKLVSYVENGASVKVIHFVTLLSGVIAILIQVFFGLMFFNEFLHVQYDDSFITYRYAFNLAHGDGLRFNPGDNSNSASSLLFVLLLAFIYFVTRIDLMNIATMINLLSVGIMSSLIVWIFVRRGVNLRNVIAGLAMMFMFTSSGRLVYWTFSGMETAFFMMLLAIAIFTTSDYIIDSRYVTGRRTWLLIALVLLSLTRVEGAIVATALGALVVATGYLHKNHKFRKENFWFLLIAPSTFAGQLLFYWAYYGSPISDPIGFKDRVQYYQRTPKLALDTILSFFQAEGLWFVGLSFIFVTILILLKQQAITARITGPLISLVLLFLFALRSPYSDELRYELVLLVPMTIITAELASSLTQDKRSVFILIFTFLTVGSIFSVNSGVDNAIKIEARTSGYQYVQSARIEASKWLELNTTPGTRVISSDIGALAYFNPSNIYIDAAGLVNRTHLDNVVRSRDVFDSLASQKPQILADTMGTDGVSGVEQIMSNPSAYYVASSKPNTSCPIPPFQKSQLKVFPEFPSSNLSIEIAAITGYNC